MITIRGRVRFNETDTMGVVYHPNYLHWFEMARVEYLRACGVSLNDLMDEGILFPIADVQMHYMNSCKFDDEYEVQVVMSAFNKAKMDFACKIYRVKDGALAVEGTCRNVFTDKSGRVIRLTPQWFEKINKVYKEEKEE